MPVTVYQSLKAVVSLQKGRVSDVRESDPIKPVPEEHIPPVLRKCNRQVAAMIQLQLLTGMRPDEVTIMRPCDIDRTEEIWTYSPPTHKTEHHRITKTIILGPKAQEILQPWLDRDPTAYLFSPERFRRQCSRASANVTAVVPPRRNAAATRQRDCHANITMTRATARPLNGPVHGRRCQSGRPDGCGITPGPSSQAVWC